jgi:uncharacterized membrane protein YedE/YeeE
VKHLRIPPNTPLAVLPASRKLTILGLLTVTGLAALTFGLGGIILALAWLLGIGLGFAIQRSRFCLASAFRDLAMFGTTSITRALVLLVLLISLSLGVAGMAGVSFSGYVFPYGIHTVVGALMFGIGMVLAGGCGAGTLWRIGEGYLLSWISLGGILSGLLVAGKHLPWWHSRLMASAPSASLIDLLGASPAMLVYLIALGGIYWWFFRLETPTSSSSASAELGIRPVVRSGQESGARLKRIFTTSWSYTTGALALSALAVAVALLTGKPWGITQAYIGWSTWLWRTVGQDIPAALGAIQPARGEIQSLGILSSPSNWITLGLAAGSFIAAVLSSEFRVRKVKSVRQVALALVGGALMGYGARIAYGCTVGALLGGIASFSVHGWVFAAFLLVGAWVGGKVLTRVVE